MVEKTIEAMIFKNLEKLIGWVGAGSLPLFDIH